MEIHCRAGVAARTVLAAFIAGAAVGAVMTVISLETTTPRPDVNHIASLESSGPVSPGPVGAASSAVSARPPDRSGTGRRDDR